MTQGKHQGVSLGSGVPSQYLVICSPSLVLNTTKFAIEAPLYVHTFVGVVVNLTK